MSENKDSDFFRESVADAKRVRQTAIENAKDYLEEEFTPKLQSMLSQTIQQEMEEEEGEHEDEDEEELELDLGDVQGEEEPEDEADEEEEEMEETEEIADQQEFNLDSVMEFLEAATVDDRHSDPEESDEVSYANPHRYGDEDLDTDEFEGGYDSIRDITSELEQNNTNMSDVDKIAEELGEDDELTEDLEDEMVEAFLEVLGEAEGDYEDHGAMDTEDMEMDHEGMEDMGDHDAMEMDHEAMDTEDVEDMEMGEFMDMIGMDMEEFMDAMEMEGEHDEEMEETVYEIDLNEFGSGPVDRPEAESDAEVSDPYDTETGPVTPEEEGFDVSGEPYDPGFEAGSSETEDLYDEEPVQEDLDLSGLFESSDSGGSLREENRNLREELKKHRQAVKILRNKINEVNLINSKLLYTNRLFKKHNLDERQKMRIIESFDETSSVREAKLVYKTLSENLSSDSEDLQESRKSSKKEQLVEALKGGLGSEKTGGSTTPREDKKQILNEDADTKDRLQKLAGLVD